MAAKRADIEQIWRKLDHCVDALMGKVQLEPHEIAMTQGMAKGLSFVLSVLLASQFENEQAVKDESMRRWQARQPTEN